MITAFADGPVFVGDGRLLDKATVIVEGCRITKVVEGNGAVPREAEKISLKGRMLLPGFIDCHVHLCMDGSPDPIGALLSEPLSITAFKAANFARRTLMAGVTSVRDMGGRGGIDLGLKQAVQSGLVPGPRMQVSGSLICMTGGHGWQIGREVDGPDETRKAARDQIKAGADIIKLMATGGVLTPSVEPGSEQLTEEELRAGIQEAHKAGKRTATHAMGTQGILNALHAGIDSIEHGVYLNEEAVSWMVGTGIPLVPTLSALYHIENQGTKAGIPGYAVEKTRLVKPHHLKSVRMAREAGVRIGMGTDAGTPFNLHGQNLGELQRLVEQGFSPSEAMESATGIASRILGVDRDLGTVEEGKLADLVVVQGDPLRDLDLLTDVTALAVVMQGGKWVRGGFSEL